MFDLYSLVDIGLIIGVVLAIAPFLGDYIGRVFLNRPLFGDRILTPVEQFIYRVLGTSPRQSMRFKEYAFALLLTSVAMMTWIYLIFTQQQLVPWNPNAYPPFGWDLAFHTAVSFTTNTDYTHYTPEVQASLGAQILSLQVAMFISAGSGLAVVAAMIRGFIRKDGTLGNFYVDLTRTITRILLPLSLVGAVVLVLLGVPETFVSTVTAHPIGGGTQTLVLGPVASWQSIDLIGSNGGGWYSSNAGFPYANPSAISNLWEIGLMMLIPISTPFAFGTIVRRPGEATPYIGTIVIVFVIALGLFIFFQAQSNPGLSSVPQVVQTGSYSVGSELRFSGPESAAFNVVSVYSNVGAQSSALGSLQPGAQLVLLFGMFTQATPGGVGTGFGTLLIFSLVAVFIGGLMVGRTPEYLGKKVDQGQVKWAASVLLIHPALVMIPAAIAILGGFYVIDHASAQAAAHSFTILIYEFTSESANNGSDMGPINDGTLFFNVTGALIMLLGRFLPMLAMLQIGSIFSKQDELPPGSGTLYTRGLTYTLYLVLMTIIVSALLFLPIIAMGPLAQIL
jgi:potassium-transporting ATPase potassium-binding subunit